MREESLYSGVMDIQTKNRLADRLNEAIDIIRSVALDIEKDRASDDSEKRIGQGLQTGPMAVLSACSVSLRGQRIS